MDAAVEDESIGMRRVFPPGCVEVLIVCNSSVLRLAAIRSVCARTLPAQLEYPEVETNHLAQRPRLLCSPDIFGQESELLGYSPGDLLLRGDLPIPRDQFLSRLHVWTDWLFRQHVLTRLQGGLDELRLVSNREGNDHADNIGTRENVLEGFALARILRIEVDSAVRGWK